MANSITADTVNLLKHRAKLCVTYGSRPVGEPYSVRDYDEKLRDLGALSARLLDVLDEYAALKGFE